ncbi:MAG: trigger factor, partial [Pseudomonadota bacterium]|nr:trigger factor [Pseudomonadota bacterium]
MQVKEVKSEGLNYELEITVEAKDIDKHVDAKLAEYGKTIKLPGFRPGKVPMDLLKQRYGKAVLGEVLESAVNDSTQKALNEKGLRPALQPKIEVKEFDEGKDLVYHMNVEVLPEFEVMDLKKLKLEKPVTKADKKSVDEALERIASGNRDTQEVDRAAKNGDVVRIDFHGRTADDNKEHPGMHAHGHNLEL